MHSNAAEQEVVVSILSIAQASQYAQGAGFSGDRLIKILSIAMAESGLNTESVNSTDPNGGSFGIVQINGSHFHSGGTTKECALDPGCAFRYAFMLSNGGTDFSPWGSFTNGSYQRYIDQVMKVVTPGVSASNPTDVASGNPINSLMGGDQFHALGLLFIAVLVVIIGATILLRTDKSTSQEGAS